MEKSENSICSKCKSTIIMDTNHYYVEKKDRVEKSYHLEGFHCLSCGYVWWVNKFKIGEEYEMTAKEEEEAHKMFLEFEEKERRKRLREKKAKQFKYLQKLDRWTNHFTN